MEDFTAIKIELDVAAQKVLNQFVIHNGNIKNQIENGMKIALDNFNVEEEIAKRTTEALRSIISDSFSYGKLRELVSKKVEPIIDSYIEKEMQKYKQ